MHSLLYGVLCGLQCVIQALFLDELIDRFLNLDFYANPNCFYLVTLVDLACTVIAWGALFRLGREEWRELRNFGFGGKMNSGSAVVDESASKNSKSMITDLSMRRHINRAAMGDGDASVETDEFNTQNSKYYEHSKSKKSMKSAVQGVGSSKPSKRSSINNDSRHNPLLAEDEGER